MRLLISFAAILLLAGCGPKHYTATATVQLNEREPQKNPDGIDMLACPRSTAGDSIQTQVSILESHALLRRVAQIIEEQNAAAFLAPYDGESTELKSLQREFEVQKSFHKALQDRMIYYGTTDPDTAIIVERATAPSH